MVFFKNFFSNAFSKASSYLSVITGLGVSLATMAITMTDWKITFEASDKAIIDNWVWTALTNLWSAFELVLPYLGIAAALALVIGWVFMLVKRAGR